MSRTAADGDCAARTLKNGGGDGADDGLRDDEGRIGKTIEEVAALEVRSERVDGVAIGRLRRVRDRVEPLGVGGQIESEHRPARARRFAGLHLVARLRRVRLEVEDRYAVDHRKHAAVTAEDAVADLVVGASMEERGDELEAA